MNIIGDWFSNKIKKIGFEDMKIAIKSNSQYIIISTFPDNEQDCLIKNTMSIDDEIRVFNELIENYDMQKSIVIYGRNSNDESIEKKYKQLRNIGFTNIYVYYGGLFEWILLQDIYGKEEFPTTKLVFDILKYRPKQNFH